MALGYILSLIILGVSILVLIVLGIVAKKKMDPTIKNIAETQKVVEGHQEHFTREIEVVQGKVERIVSRVEDLQGEAESRMQGFEELSLYASQLGQSISTLKDHSSDFSQGIARNVFVEVKEDGPKIVKTFRLAIKRTIEKQKARANKGSVSN